MDVSEIAAQIKTLADLDKIAIIGSDGAIEVRIGWNIGLFFDGGATLPRRLAANAVVRDFLQTFPGKLTHYLPTDARSLCPAAGVDLTGYLDAEAEAATARSGRNANDQYGADLYGFDGGKQVMEPAPWYLTIGTASRERPEPSSVTVNLPMTWPSDTDLGPLVTLFVRWCGLLQPEHGTTSPGLVFTQDGGTNALITSYPLLRRFPGLDYVNASRWEAAARKQPRTIRTIGWLTALDDGFVAALGGPDHVAAALDDEEILIHRYTGGIVIQAGPRPRLGDRNRGDIPPAYRHVARLVEPLIMRRFSTGIFYPLPAPLDLATETDKWLRRFD